jgi:hypothetical protein
MDVQISHPDFADFATLPNIVMRVLVTIEKNKRDQQLAKVVP